MKLPKVKVFHVEKNPKRQALKVLEETAELVEAVKNVEEAIELDADPTFPLILVKEEACDVLVALANLLDLYGVDKDELKDAMELVERRNAMRGRYECE